MSGVRLSGITKAYGGRTVLAVDELVIAPGEFFVLVGPSGSGKTTLLKILAGLVAPDTGTVEIGGRPVAGMPPHERPIGVVFQGLALWPHLSVRGNLALGLNRVVQNTAERSERIETVARELDITEFLKSKPARLSGGEQQRVALARALVRRPSLMLLDEAFSDLDARLRRTTARLVRRLHDEHGITTLLITHDRTDAHLLADRIGVMQAGRLVACGRPDELYAAPKSAFAAEFLSDAALLTGPVAGGSVETAIGSMPLLAGPGGQSIPEGGERTVAVRPDEISLGAGPVTGRVIACEFAGGPWLCRIRVGEDEVVAKSERPLETHATVQLTAPTAPRHALEVSP